MDPPADSTSVPPTQQGGWRKCKWNQHKRYVQSECKSHIGSQVFHTLLYLSWQIAPIVLESSPMSTRASWPMQAHVTLQSALVTQYLILKLVGVPFVSSPGSVASWSVFQTALIKVVGEFVDCLLEPDNDCYNQCSYYQGGGNDYINIPLLTPLTTNCSVPSLLDDWRNCLPTFPVCDTVQDTIIPFTCDGLCCSDCQSKLLNLENCFYNWISGHDCSFTCSGDDRRSLTDKKTTIPRTLQDNSGARVCSRLPNETGIGSDAHSWCRL